MSGRPVIKGLTQMRIEFALLAALAVISFGAEAVTHMLSREQELRYWSVPSRPEARRGAVLSAFKHAHPCPSNGKSSGPRPGWIMDHVVPLACGGADAMLPIGP